MDTDRLPAKSAQPAASPADNPTQGRMMKVKELVEHLKTLPQDALVVSTGHFGSPIDFTVSDFNVETVSYRSAAGMMVIDCPYIGEGPD